MKIYFTLLFICTSFFAMANSIGGNIDVYAHADYNCNKEADKDEIIPRGFVVTVTGQNYTSTQTATSSIVHFSGLSFGTYTITVSYNVTFTNGMVKNVTASKSETLTSATTITSNILLDACPPAPTYGKLQMSSYADANCNNTKDGSEGIVIGANYVVSGNGFNKSYPASGSITTADNLSAGSYTVTATYSYTFPDGVTKTLTSQSQVQISPNNTAQVDLRFNACYSAPPPPVEKSKIIVTTYLDRNCNKLADKDELLKESHKVRLEGKGYGRTVYPRSATSIFDDLTMGAYVAKAEYDYYDAQRRKYELVATGNASVVSGKSNTIELLFSPCDIKIDTVPKEPEVPRDICGRWLNNTMQTSTVAKVSGNNIITNNRESLIIGLLKTRVTFDADYKWFWEKKSGSCKVTGTIVKPNGERTNWTDNFNITILQPGTYTVTYQVKCQDRICETGVKTIICTDVIVCNCGPMNNQVTVYTGSGKTRTTKLYNSGDSIIVNKAERIALDYRVNCEGNVCDGFTTYEIQNNFGQTVVSGNIDRSDLKKLSGNYTLKITARCGNKSCITLQYPMRIYGEVKEVYVDARARWGNQIGVNFGSPKLDNARLNKKYTGIMFGIIADIPVGQSKRWHLWPAFNFASSRYCGEIAQTPSSSNIAMVDTKHFMLRGGLDVSYAFPLNQKGANFHLYGGLSFDGGIWRKQTVTTTPSTYYTTWQANNKSDSAQKLSTNINLGILIDLNRTWTIGANYYRYRVLQNKNIYTPLTDRGISVRLAWFYNQKGNIRK